MRTFEVPANNSFLLTQRTHDQANILFKEGESIACFATPSELIEQITFYLEHETERSVITQKGFLCAQKFTLETQLAMLCKTLFIT